MTRLARIRERLDAITPGQWTHRTDGDAAYVNAGTIGVTCHIVDRGRNEGDAPFIAHAPEDVRLLLDVAEAARNVLDLCLTEVVGYTECAACRESYERCGEWWMDVLDGHDEDCPLAPVTELRAALAALDAEEPG